VRTSIDDTSVGDHTCARAIASSRDAPPRCGPEIFCADELTAPHATTLASMTMEMTSLTMPIGTAIGRPVLTCSKE